MPIPTPLQDDLAWPAALDALVAAPEHHRLLLENAIVRVLETRIPPGERTPLHTHRWPSTLYVISWSPFVRRDAQGQIALDTRTAPPPVAPFATFSPPLPAHSLENVGESELHVISVELKPGHV